MSKMFRNVSIRKKLNAAFAVIIGYSILAVVVSIVGIFMIKGQFNYFYNTPYKNETAVNTYRIYAQSAMRNLLRSITTNVPSERERYLAEVQNDVNEQMAQFQFLKQNSSATELLTQLETHTANLKPVRDKIIQLMESDRPEEALDVYNNEYEPLAQPIVQGLIDLSIYQGDRAAESFDHVNFIRLLVSVTLIAASSISVLLMIYFSRTLAKLLLVPIDELENAAKSMAEGNLDVTITYEEKDELGTLASSMKKVIETFRAIITDIQYCLGEMAESNFTVTSKCREKYVGSYAPILESMRKIKLNLNDVLGQIQDSSRQVQMGAQNMSQSSQSLAESTSIQAGSVQELTATASELNSRVMEASNHAKSVSNDVQAVGKDAQMSQEQMSKIVHAMENISNTSKQIEIIIRTIEEIASQTNLLSLNAAIEAARAGEAGKGFAVVANEIGKLAAESAQAATNTKNLIQISIHEIEDGNEIVRTTSAFLGDVLKRITGIVASVAEISKAAENQALSVAEISKAIEQISSVTEDNSAIAEESSATSEEFFAQVESLNGMIEKFRIEKKNG